MIRLLPVAVIMLLVASGLVPAGVEVIVSTAGPTSEFAQVGDRVSFMRSFALSPDGSWWAADLELDDSLRSLHVRGQGVDSREVVWVEGSPAPGGLLGAIHASPEDRQLSINHNGELVGLARHREQGVILGEFVYQYDGQQLSVVAEEGATIPALPMANYGSDVDFAEAFLSPNIVRDGTAAFVADNIVGDSITTDTDLVALVRSGAQLAGPQKGVTQYAGHPLQRIDDGQFYVRPDGNQFLFTGDTTALGTEDDIVVVGGMGTPGQVVLRENHTPVSLATGIEVFDAATRGFLAANGDWLVAGDTTLGTDLLIRNGHVLASEGDSSPDGFSYVGEPIAFTADDAGNYAWIWQTSNPDRDRDTILVYNGTDILLSEGDVYFFDQNGDGQEEPALIEHLFLDERDLALAGGHAYLMTEVDEPDSTVLIGWNFIRVDVPEAFQGDFDGNSLFDSRDLDLLLSEGPIAEGVVVTPGANDQFDLNGDGMIDLLDRDDWLAGAATANGLLTPYLLGDANLDGFVDVTDFNQWNTNKFTNSLSWVSGDFNGDGAIDVGDFNIWNNAKFSSSRGQVVPEPTGIAYSLCPFAIGCWLLSLSRRTSSRLAATK